MTVLHRLCSLILLCGCFGMVAAQDTIETIRLSHRLADQLIPELRPLLAPGGAMTGTNELLIIRTTPVNLEQLRPVIAALDRPVRRLLISVRHAGQSSDLQAGAGVNAGIGQAHIVTADGPVANRGAARLEIRSDGHVVRGQVLDAHRSTAENIAQQVQTIEGGRAFIQVGQSLPVPMRQRVPVPGGYAVSDSIVYRDIGSGFYAQPRLSGERVTLDIFTANDAPGAIYGSAEMRRIATRISGRLGEWLPLGGVTQQVERNDRSMAGIGTSASGENRQVWLKVEALD